MKIHSIEADNFKLFTTNFHKIQDITNAEMILFNGPNGYGKTSVFDIIEFCLTGEN
ncbi:MAG: AAA family ATPase [Clostridia bacterium]